MKVTLLIYNNRLLRSSGGEHALILLGGGDFRSSILLATTVTTTPSNGEHRQVSEHLDLCAFTFHCSKISLDQTSVVIGTARIYEFGI